MTEKYTRTDIRGILGSIHVPVLVLSRRDHHEMSWTPSARFLAERIAGARHVELEGRDLSLWVGDQAEVLRVIDAFLGEIRREEAELERVLATVLFTDIAGSTEKLAELGNAAWGDLVERHHARVRALLERYRGTEVDTAGDGFFASFDGPARAIRCARAIVDEVKPLGIEVRAGLHTGECEVIDGKIGGMAVNIGARIGSAAETSEVLVSQTVKDLVVGSGLRFEDRGEHELKGVDGAWRLYRLVENAELSEGAS
jgi:class 3 adenylate cyclase